MVQKMHAASLKAILIVSSSLLLITTFALLVQTQYSGNSIFHSQGNSIQALPHEALGNTIEIEVDKNYLLGKFNPAQEDDFIEIDSKYTQRRSQYLRKETYEAFIDMHEAAFQAGIQLTIVSSTRNFDYQKALWERKWSGQTRVEGKNLAQSITDPVERAKTILKYSAMPGTSRHHWGTDIDLNALENAYFESELGKKTYTWLKENASIYGFCQPYTPKNISRPLGYEEEKWHWSYIPLAKSFLRQYIQKVHYDDLKGFEGWETARTLNVIDNYVLSINKDCKE